MPSAYLDACPRDARARALRVRVAAFDVDGTLTDGRLTYDSDGRELKSFQVQDGLGLKLLLQAGVQVALITARHSPIVAARAQELGLRQVYQGVADKRACLLALCASLRLEATQAAFMGDDLPDLPALTVAGLAVAPANAHPWVRERAHWCTPQRGGDGAVRALCDLLLSAQGQAEAVLARYLAP